MNIGIKEIASIGIAELLTMIFFSQLFLVVIWLKYSFGSTEYQLLSKQDYETITEKESQKSYKFVVVQYNARKEIIKETFYKVLGDFNTFKYNNSRYIGSSGLYVSNLLLAVFPFTGVFLMLLNNLLSLPVTSASERTTVYNQQLVDWAFMLFFPSFFAFLIKFGLDSITGTYEE